MINTAAAVLPQVPPMLSCSSGPIPGHYRSLDHKPMSFGQSAQLQQATHRPRVLAANAPGHGALAKGWRGCVSRGASRDSSPLAVWLFITSIWSVPCTSASSLSHPGADPGGLSMASLMGPCRRPMGCLTPKGDELTPDGCGAPSWLHAASHSPPKPRTQPPVGSALHKSQLCGCSGAFQGHSTFLK